MHTFIGGIIMSENNNHCCSVSRNTGNKTQADLTAVPSHQTETKFQDKMVALDGSKFIMGTNDNEGFKKDGEGPARTVLIDPFSIDAYAVTNREFQQFVEETGYKTEAESFGWSFVFHLFVDNKHSSVVQQLAGTSWWYAVQQAYWFQPEGTGSTIDDRLDHPVVHVSWNDANVFAQWAGKRLPTEAEWEYAARGGLIQKQYLWGDELTPNGEHYCNIWQGEFPNHNSQEDGYIGTAPAQSFPPNQYGLYNMTGNVWEWCADWFTNRHPDIKVNRSYYLLSMSAVQNRLELNK